MFSIESIISEILFVDSTKSNISSILDSHEPDGEWDIDSSEVSAEDLLESDEITSLVEIKDTLQPHPEGVIKTSILTPKSVLISGEEE